MADGQKMSNYTPLASGEKNYFFGTGEGSVVAVGKVSTGQPKANRLVKLSEIAGDKLPSGGTEGQVLTKTSSGEAWANAPSELPSGGTVGQVLKKTASGVAFNDVNEVPTSGSVDDVLTKGLSGYRWAPRTLYKVDTKTEGSSL